MTTRLQQDSVKVFASSETSASIRLDKDKKKHLQLRTIKSTLQHYLHNLVNFVVHLLPDPEPLDGIAC